MMATVTELAEAVKPSILWRVVALATLALRCCLRKNNQQLDEEVDAIVESPQ
jgi:hypothetical protein